jgi:ABC-type transporter Mla subunit MlaD
MRLRLGLVVLVTIGLLALMIVMFGSLPNLFKSTTPYTVRFTDAPGLAPGAPVRRSGVKIGTVKGITLDEDRGIVRVQITIDQPYTIRKSEQATLTAGLFGSDVGIDLVPRDPEEKEVLDRSPYEPGTELVGVRAASVNTLIKGAADVVPSTQQTLNEMRKSVQRIEKFVARAEKTIPLTEETLRVYRDLGNDTRKLVPEIQKTNAEIQKTNAQILRLAIQAEEVVPEVQRTSEEFRGLTRDVRAALPEVMRTNKQIADTAKTIQDMAPTVESTLDEYRGLAGDVRKMMPVLRDNVEDVGMAARNVARFAERADVMLQTNQPKIEKSLDNLNTVLERAGVLFSDANVKNATRTIDNVAKASDNFPSISKNADELARQGIVTLKRVGDTLNRVDAALTNADRVLRPLGERGERIARNADESLQKANTVLTDLQTRSGGLFTGFNDTNAKLNLILDDVRALLKAIDKADGTFRRFLVDPSLYNTVDATAASVLKLLPRIDRMLKDFETFADKLARHPEAIGIGGVVRPGDGLKNPPTPPIQPQHGFPVQAHSPKR